MSVIAAAIITTGVGTAYAASEAADAQDNATQAARDSAKDANALSKERFEWEKSVYDNDTRPMLQADQALKQKIVDSQIAQSEKQQEFADEQNAYYKETFRPVEQKVAAEAMGYDSADNIERRSGIAAANVNQQFSNAAGQKSRLLARYGLNPNSSAFAAEVGADSRAQALGAAGAATGAAFDTMDKGIALRAGAANFGRNMPNTAATYYAGSSGSAGVAGNASTSAIANSIAGNNTLSNSYAARVGGIYDYGNAMNRAYTQESNQWKSIAGGLGNLTGSLVQDAGGWGAAFKGIQGILSDRRIKTDIRRVGVTDGGLPIYVYRYQGAGPFFMGVMAQEAALAAPGSVSSSEGLLRVDYSKLH